MRKLSSTLISKTAKSPILIYAGLLLLAIGGSAPLLCAQQPGSLDTTFNSPTGFVAGDLSTQAGLNGAAADDVGSVALDSQGRIVVAGETSGKLSLARYMPDGSFDLGFGTGGVVFTNFSSAEFGIALDHHDNVILAFSTNSHFGVARFLATNGSLDVLNFGAAGIAVLDFSGNNTSTDRPVAVAVDSSDRIVVAGNSSVISGLFNFGLSRFLNSGAPDTTFGNGNGWVATAFPMGSRALALAVAPTSGKIVLAGQSQNDFALARYLNDGTLDTTFGPGSAIPGTVLTDFNNAGSSDIAWSVVVNEQQNGMKILASGQSDASGLDNDFALARYNDDGSLDSTFNGGGKVITDFAAALSGVHTNSRVEDGITSSAWDGQGGVFAAGTTIWLDAGSCAHEAVALAHYDKNGALDSTFGIGGLVVPYFAAETRGLTGLALDASARLLVSSTAAASTGGSGSGCGTPGPATDDFLIARFIGRTAQADLATSIQVSGTALPGNTLTYTVTTTNNGPDDAQNVSIGVNLDPNLSISSPGCVNNICSFLSASLLKGKSVTVILKPTIVSNVAPGTQITTTAGAQATTSDPYLNNNTAAASTVVPSADLAIAIQQSATSLTVGGSVTYTLTIHNNGPGTASSVVVSDTLPSSLSLVPGSCTPASNCTVAGNSITANFASLSMGGSQTLTLQATLNSGVADGTLVDNLASVTSSVPDSNSSNNSAHAFLVVQNKADISITQTVAKGNNKQLTFTITAKNNGPYAASQIVLNDLVPAGTTFQTLSPNTWSCSAPKLGGTGTINCTLAGLATNTVQSLTFSVKVSVSGSTNITNTANIATGSFDPIGTNNSSTLVTKVSGN